VGHPIVVAAVVVIVEVAAAVVVIVEVAAAVVVIVVVVHPTKIVPPKGETVSSD
jgi:hypothetical protein